MGRPLQSNKWFNDFVNDTWKGDGLCGGPNFHLPWTADFDPGVEARRDMAAICEKCPVLLRCAEYALSSHGGSGALGGFHAGVWIPWTNESGSMSTESRAIKAHSRTLLRRLIRHAAAVAAPIDEAVVALEA